MRKVIYMVLVVAVLYAFVYYQNNDIQTTTIRVSDHQIPKSFEGFKIAHISDLHNKAFGNDQIKLLDEIKVLEPNVIVITGDLVDRRKFNLSTAMDFIEGAVKIAPVYYVSGNHEAWSGAYEDIVEKLNAFGVHIMDNRTESIESYNGDIIEFIGVADPDFQTTSYFEGTDASIMEKNLRELENEPVYQILLSHRPELFSLYARYNVNLTLSGHAHGGQFRLPFIGGVVAPDQGIFPEYTSGVYEKDGSKMVVSRGLGNSIIPIRLFNRPQIILIEFTD